MNTLFDVAKYTQPVDVEEWCNDNWESPDAVAKFIASLVTAEDHVIWEPCAGTGRIAQYLPGERTICSEINPLRVEVGKVRAPNAWWRCEDAIEQVSAL